jgi:hypothetical protein
MCYFAGRTLAIRGPWPASAGAYVTVGSDSTKLSVKGVGEMLDWMRESKRVLNRTVGYNGCRNDGRINKSLQLLEMLRMSNISFPL